MPALGETLDAQASDRMGASVFPDITAAGAQGVAFLRIETSVDHGELAEQDGVEDAVDIVDGADEGVGAGWLLDFGRDGHHCGCGCSGGHVRVGPVRRLEAASAAAAAAPAEAAASSSSVTRSAMMAVEKAEAVRSWDLAGTGNEEDICHDQVARGDGSLRPV
jgi:hypothetical protein